MSTPAPQQRGPCDVAARVERFYTEHVSLVRSVCRKLLRNPNEAEDAVQQTFLSAQRALANGSSPREPAAWLVTIARNECLRRVQARMREPLPVDGETADVGADAHTAAVRRHEAGELRQAIAELPDQQRDAILLREVRGLSYEEVATALAVTTSAVESLIFRARRSLQTRLREALAALSPGELAGRIIGGGGLAAPAAAKVAAIGVGTALVTGGAVLGPAALGLHHVAPARHIAAKPASRRPSAAPSAPTTPVAPAPTQIWVAPVRHRTQDVVRRETGDGTTSKDSSQAESSDSNGAAPSSGGEREASGGSGATSSQETQTPGSASTSTADGAEVETSSSSGAGSPTDGTSSSSDAPDSSSDVPGSGDPTTTPDLGQTGD